MIEILKSTDVDNLLAILLLGLIAFASLFIPDGANTKVADSVVTGIIGYLAKGPVKGAVTAAVSAIKK